MSTRIIPTSDGETAWNPGLGSVIPTELMPLCTLYRSEAASVDFAQAREISEFTGLSTVDVAAFRPERLMIHEVLIRVTADLSVPDGPDYDVLGINLRKMAHTILATYVAAERDALLSRFETIAQNAADCIEIELAPLFAPSAPTPRPAKKPSLFGRLFGGEAAPQPSSVAERLCEHEMVEQWRARRSTTGDSLESACLTALAKIVGTMLGKRGRLVGDKTLVRDLAVRMVCNEYGSDELGKLIEPIVVDAANSEGFRILPSQAEPFVMNVKGASAAGKSTVRPRQKELAQRLGVPWEDFALVSPDYWRKYLLDYDSLGNHAKYAAMLTGQELEIIDVKLDRYMARKAADGTIPHLLIDRFRFDSFFLGQKNPADSSLLTRFGERIFLFFIVTEPAQTVERAWLRGQSTGRYKAVDDLLYHNVEAYTGIPDLFFSWARVTGKRIHFEFLDNNVQLGERPRTIAFGWNGAMTVLDVERMLAIDLYRKVNLKAKAPDEVLADAPKGAAENTVFLERCVEFLESVTFASFDTGKVYGQIVDGAWVYRDAELLGQISGGADWANGLRTIGFDADAAQQTDEPRLDVGEEQLYTVGSWAS